MDEKKAGCPNRCIPTDMYGNPVDTPFYFPVCCCPEGYELGVLIYPDLTLSNRFVDGTVGVPPDFADHYENHDCMPHCIKCNEEIVWLAQAERG